MNNRVDVKRYALFCETACRHYGLSDEMASVTARLLVKTDQFGIWTHGTLNLLPYLEKIAAGGIDAQAIPEVVVDGPAYAVVDGHHAMPVYSGFKGLEIGMRKARENGVSYVGIRHSGHYGACGVYSVTAAEQGFIALVMSNTVPNMAAPGGKGAIIGNSPISYAIPAGTHKPVFLDIATSNVAGMKVINKLKAGEPIPEGWIVDKDGMPTTQVTMEDIQAGNWALSPMGGHKGYGLSFFIEVMCAVLTGGATFNVKNWMNLPQTADVSHSLILIDVQKFMPLDVFADRMAEAIGFIASKPTAGENGRIFLPGEMEWERYEKSVTEGMALPDLIAQNARALADKIGYDFESCVID